MVGDPPIPALDFDYRDAAQLARMYAWAGSAGRLSAWLRENGRDISPGTINVWRRRYNIAIANEAYRAREEMRGGTAVAEDPEGAVAELLEYLQSRQVPVAPPPTPATGERTFATALVASDLHFPYHHQGAFDLFCKLCAVLEPEEVVLAGDIFDWPQLSRFVSAPSENRQLQADLDACREHVLARINAAAPGATKRFLLGNHEHGRWRRYLWERAPALASLRCLEMETLLGLAEMGWVYQGHEWWPTDALVICHGWRHTNQLGGGSAASARKQFLDMGCSGASGHTHRLGSYFRRDRSGYYVWAEIGCLCDARAMQQAGLTATSTPTRVEDWHLGCLRLHYKPEGSAFRLELIPFLEDEDGVFAIVAGREVR